jgi:hypothetical protein
MLIMHDYKLIQIFSDLNMILTRVQYQPIGCGRVLDGIRNYLAPESAEKGKARQGFEKVGSFLNFSPDYGTFVPEKRSNLGIGKATTLRPVRSLIFFVERGR